MIDEYLDHDFIEAEDLEGLVADLLWLLGKARHHVGKSVDLKRARTFQTKMIKAQKKRSALATTTRNNRVYRHRKNGWSIGRLSMKFELSPDTIKGIIGAETQRESRLLADNRKGKACGPSLSALADRKT